MRSATAEVVYAEKGYSVKSAGTEFDARIPLSDEIINGADLIFVMEEKQKVILDTLFSDVADKKKIIVLNIPDEYEYMEEALVDLIIEKVTPYLK